MTNKPSTKYITKTIRFNGKELTLYSIDGLTWSTRKDELHEIKERHETERLALTDPKAASLLKAKKQLASKYRRPLLPRPNQEQQPTAINTTQPKMVTTEVKGKADLSKGKKVVATKPAATKPKELPARKKSTKPAPQKVSPKKRVTASSQKQKSKAGKRRQKRAA